MQIGDKVTCAGDLGKLVDGPFEEIRYLASAHIMKPPVWLVAYESGRTALTNESYLEPVPHWVPCPGEHRGLTGVGGWERKVER